MDQLGETKGNIDTGATLGSYIGLLMLGGVYVAIGIFASAITENQIVSFVLSLFICVSATYVRAKISRISLLSVFFLFFGLL